MKQVASSDQELTVEERNLLSVAYKNVIGARRASWRIVSSIEQKEETKGNALQVGFIKEYRTKIENELSKICEDILQVLDKHLIPSAATGESKVFYHKMLVLLSEYVIVCVNHFQPATFTHFRSYCIVGRATIIDILLNSRQVTSVVNLLTSLWKLTRLPAKLR